MSFKYEKQFSKRQNILNFLSREIEGATLHQIGETVFNESPRQANQTYAKQFYAGLEEGLHDMILYGEIESEGDRYFFKTANPDIPLDDDDDF